MCGKKTTYKEKRQKRGRKMRELVLRKETTVTKDTGEKKFGWEPQGLLLKKFSIFKATDIGGVVYANNLLWYSNIQGIFVTYIQEM